MEAEEQNIIPASLIHKSSSNASMEENNQTGKKRSRKAYTKRSKKLEKQFR
jgi:hypothetical protein